MRKKQVLCLFCLIVLLLPAAALCAENAPAYGTSRGKAALLTDANMGKQYAVTGKGEGTWYKFECEEDDTCFLTVECTGGADFDCVYYNVVDGRNYFKSNATDGALKSIRVSPSAYAVSSFEVSRGEIIYLCFTGLFNAYSPKFQFSICNSRHHQIGKLQRTTQEPTCTEPGKLATYCTLCNQPCEYTDIPALGHQPGAWKTEAAESCADSGRSVQYCSVCGEVLAAESIPPVGHRPGKATVAREATCLSTGLRVTQCTVCNEILSSEELPITDHHGKWVEESKPTCTASGQRLKLCADCGAILDSETIPAAGHKIGEWKTVREAACLQSGLREKQCTVCGAVLQSETQPALGHRYTEWQILTEATKEHEGERRRHCEGCGDTQYETIPKIPKFLGIF